MKPKSFFVAAMAAVLLGVAIPASAEDAYIESNGTQFMNTGYYPGPKTKIEVDFQLTEAITGKDCVFGNYGGGASNFSVLLYAQPGNTYFQFCGKDGEWDGGVSTGVKIDTERHTMVIDVPSRKGTLLAPGGTVQGQVDFKSSWEYTNTANWPIAFFASCNNTIGTSARQGAKVKIYSAKIWESEDGGNNYTLLHDYTPAIKNGIAGLLDSVTGTFLYDTRTSGLAFAYGGDVPTIDDDPYVESDGTSAINLGVTIAPKLKIQVDYAFTDTADPTPDGTSHYQQHLFGPSGLAPSAAAYINSSGNVSIGSGDSWTAQSTGIKADTLRRTIIIDTAACNWAFMTGVTTNWHYQTSADLTKTGTRPISLFGHANNDAATSFTKLSKAKVYGLKIWHGGTLVRDLAPRSIDGTAGFEDLVTGKFFTCAGLTASANAPTALSGRGGKGDAFIESDGSLYSVIDTRYFPSGKTKVEVDFQFARNAGSKDCLLGNYGSTYTVLVYAPNGGNFNLEAKDGGHTTLALSNTVKSDTDRHTAVIDAPAKHVALYDADGVLQGEADIPNTWTHNNTANWPLTLFGSSTNAWGKTRQNAVARIFSLKISESDDNGATYTPVHTYTPCVKGGIPGFLDEVTGEFISGGNLVAGGAVMEIDDDPYVESPNGGCFFDTGYYVTSNTCIVCDFMLLEQQNEQQFPFEAGPASAGKSFMRMYGNGSSGTGDFAYALGQDTYKSLVVYYSPMARRQITLDALNCKAKVAVNGYTIREMSTAATGRQPEKSSETLKIFSNYNMTKNTLKGRLYGFKIYEEGTLVRDYVPICQAGTYALVDKVTGKTLAKASSSKDFTGSTANEALNDSFFSAEKRDEDAYIESDGTQGINLGYYTTPQTRYEIDYQLTATNKQYRPFGEADTSVQNLHAELYVQDNLNVAFGVGDTWKGHATGVASDTDRHVAFIDFANRECGYSGYKIFAFDSAVVCKNTAVVPMWLFAKGTSAGGSFEKRAKMRLYAFRIFEAGELVHEYLPYKNGDTVGLYDTMTGNVVTSSVSGSNAFRFGGGLGYGKYAGTKRSLVVNPSDAKIAKTGNVTLSAYAPGAVGYVWKKNGEELAGETGETLNVNWRTPGKEAVDTYTVAPVFFVDGKEVEGEEQSCEVENLPLGLLIIVR